jgi:hypothetical protein
MILTAFLQGFMFVLGLNIIISYQTYKDIDDFDSLFTRFYFCTWSKYHNHLPFCPISATFLHEKISDIEVVKKGGGTTSAQLIFPTMKQW